MVEIEIGLAARCERKGGIVGLIGLYSGGNLDRSLGFQLHTSGTEYFLKRSEGKIHVEHVERLLVLLTLHQLGIAAVEVREHRPPHLHVVILLGSEDERRGDLMIAHLGIDYIASCRRIVFRLSPHIGRIGKVKCQLTLSQRLIIGRESRAHGKPCRR